MTIAPTVYVFVCGRSKYLGLSLMKDGANLPPCSVPPYAWKRVNELLMRAHEFAIRNIEPRPAIDSLIARGYYVDQPVADVLAFPEKRKLKERF
jgi:hypothetical protein